MAKTDLLIEYDEANGEIKFYEALHDGKRHFAAKVPVSMYLQRGADEAERSMGETVFTFFDRWSDVKIGLRNYLGEVRESLALSRSVSATLAERGDAQAQYHLAIDCFTSGVRNRSRAEIEEADSWLKRAAANGSEDAIEYLNKHWEREKASALRSITGLSE